ncbi:MAG: glycosyltransferase family 9 protein [Burkholderiales bacterium]|nr:glycosyltransferase family 9 protein [Burkholderiales bacterium]
MKILLIKRGAMGDILMSTPLIRQLHQQCPQATIDYCIAKPFAAILKDNPYLNNIITLDEQTFANYGIFKYIKFVWSIRNKYDYIFNLGKSWQLNLLNKIFRGKKIGYARESISKFLLNKYVLYNDIGRYHGLYYLDLLNISGLGIADYRDINLDISITAKDREIVHSKLNELGINHFVIVVNSGGNNQYESGGIRMLPSDKVEQLLIRLLQGKNLIILLGGKVDWKNYQKYVSIDPKHIINCAGIFTLPQSTYLISLSKHFYTTDCGSMHLGVATNIGNKMTCFFGPTAPTHVLPPNNQFNIIWNDCAIFDKSYPLKGKFNKNSSKYFSKLDILSVIK